MRICIVSDTHGYHNSVVMPSDIDILIHCGDSTINGEMWEMKNFLEWFSNQKAVHKIFINGNHEVQVCKKSLNSTRSFTQLMVDEHNKNFFTDIIYLENQSIEIEGLKFYGSPMTPEFFDWAYMYSRNGEGKEIWAKIPDNTDVLITHGPPETVLDSVRPTWGYPSLFAGCPYLLERVAEIKPKIHAFGHIHSTYGTRRLANPKFSETLFVNGATCNERYVPVNPPIVVDTETWEVV